MPSNQRCTCKASCETNSPAPGVSVCVCVKGVWGGGILWGVRANKSGEVDKHASNLPLTTHEFTLTNIHKMHGTQHANLSK